MPFRNYDEMFPPDVTSRMRRVYDRLLQRLGLVNEADRQILAAHILRAAELDASSDEVLLAESERRTDFFRPQR